MKRALAVFAVVALLGVAGLANQISGKWEGVLRLLPSTELGLRSSSLTLTYAWDAWTVSSIAKFGDTDLSTSAIDFGFTTLEFDFSGALGPISLTGDLVFNGGITTWKCKYCASSTSTSYTVQTYSVTPPEYMSASVKGTLDFAGVSFTGQVEHWAYPYYPGYGCWPCTQTGSYMLYALIGELENFKARVRFNDCCDGIEFKDLYVWWYDLSLCCGVTFDITLKFTKSGFSWVDIYFSDIFAWCCNIDFDFEILFTETSKYIYLYPSIGDFEGCVSVYMDVYPNELTPTSQNPVIQGIDIYGLEISCEFGECLSASFLTVFKVPPKSWCEYPAWYKNAKFTGKEFERAEFTFCGPACCGGTYQVDVVTYFGPDGGLFDLTRLLASVDIPLMSNFTLKLDFVLPLVSTGYGDFTLDFGWEFSF